MEKNKELKTKDFEFRVKAAVFLSGLSAVSLFSGFVYALGLAKKSDDHVLEKGINSSKNLANLHNAGSTLALKALGIGSVFAIGGVSTFCYCIWKLSGAKDMKDFRTKIGTLFPKVPKNDPQGRTEFSSVTDLLQYISDEDKKR